jgi:hypothetical protein
MNMKKDPDNELFKNILKKHMYEFKKIVLKNNDTYHIVEGKTIKITDDIYLNLKFNNIENVTVTTESSDDNGKSKQTKQVEKQKEYIELSDSIGHVFSYTLTLQELLDYLKVNYVPVVEKKQEPKLKPIIEHKLYEINILRANKFDFKTDTMSGDSVKFKISKSIDNIFLEKELYVKLMSHINRFNNREWYIKRGIPRTMGVLLHGVPGCGKTSFIKALTSFTKRRIVTIDFKIVKTIAHLHAIFKGQMIDSVSQDTKHLYTNDQVVYVFEDFDCMSDIFMDRDIKEQEKKDDDTGEIEKLKRENVLLRAKLKKLKKISHKFKPKKNDDDEKKDKDDKDDDYVFDSSFELEDDKDYKGYNFNSCSITLSNFLEVLDGIIEMDGRIIVMTTNKRHLMDSALIRPGRIDLDLELKPPSITLIGYIFKFMYEEVSSSEFLELFEKYGRYLVGNVASTAKVINCFMYTDPEDGLKSLLDFFETTVKVGDDITFYNSLENPTVDSGYCESIFDVSKFQDNVDDLELEYSKNGKTNDNVVDIIETIGSRNITVKSFDCLSGQYSVDNILIPNFENLYITYITNNNSSKWIIFDFVQSIKLSSYTLSSRQVCKKDKCEDWTLYNWGILGSNDKVDWKVIDERKKEQSMITDLDNDKDFYVDSREYFRYIKLLHFGNSWCLFDKKEIPLVFSLHYIKFFGEIGGNEKKVFDVSKFKSRVDDLELEYCKNRVNTNNCVVDIIETIGPSNIGVTCRTVLNNSIKVESVLVPDGNKPYTTLNCDGFNFLQFYFGQSIILSSYTLKSSKIGDYILYNWEILGSNNNLDWYNIDSRFNEKSMIVDIYSEKNFYTTSSESFKYIKLTTTDNSWRKIKGCIETQHLIHIFSLDYVKFFGTVV